MYMPLGVFVRLYELVPDVPERINCFGVWGAGTAGVRGLRAAGSPPSRSLSEWFAA